MQCIIAKQHPLYSTVVGNRFRRTHTEEEFYDVVVKYGGGRGAVD